MVTKNVETQKYYLIESLMGLGVINNNKDIISVLEFGSTIDEAITEYKNFSNLNFSSKIAEFFKGLDISKELTISSYDLGNYLKENYSINFIVCPYCEIKGVEQSFGKEIFKSDWAISNGLINKNDITGMFTKLMNKNLLFDDTCEYLKIINNLEISINKRICRIKEWYSLHFPELSQVFVDNTEFLNKVKEIRHVNSNKDESSNTKKGDEITEMINKTMGSKHYSEEDIEIIARDVEELFETKNYKKSLQKLLENKISTSLPNTYQLLGGDCNLIMKLVEKAGGINKLSLLPGSTIQILGSEKSFAQAVLENKNKPKYGFIYSAILIKQTPFGVSKGKIARKLANKIALCVRVDCGLLFNEEVRSEETLTFGKKCKETIQNAIEMLKNQSSNKSLSERKGKKDWESKKIKNKQIPVSDFKIKRRKMTDENK